MKKQELKNLLDNNRWVELVNDSKLYRFTRTHGGKYLTFNQSGTMIGRSEDFKKATDMFQDEIVCTDITIDQLSYEEFIAKYPK